MKIHILLVLTALVYCNCQSTAPSVPSSTAAAASVKDRLLARVQELDTRIEAEIKKLTEEKRENLIEGLEAEDKRIHTIADELKSTTPGPEALRLLEEELFQITVRVDREVAQLARESATQEQLLATAKNLKQYVAEEADKLEQTNGTAREKERAQDVADRLRQEERRVETLVTELTAAQTTRRIQTIEVELRAIEVRVTEELRRLGYRPPVPDPNPVTSRPAPTGAQ